MTAPNPGGLLLVRGKELHGLPVVGIAEGEALADVKDLIYSPTAGALLGVTLNKHGGLFAGPLKKALWMQGIHALGRDAVMVENANALETPDPPAEVTREAAGRNVIGNQVLTDAGQAIGTVVDLIVQVGMVGSDPFVGKVVGYEVTGDPALQGRAGQPLLLPLPYTLAVSGTTLLVPAAVEPFIRDDLSGFGAAVLNYRAQLDGGNQLTGGSPATAIAPPAPAAPPPGAEPDEGGYGFVDLAAAEASDAEKAGQK